MSILANSIIVIKTKKGEQRGKNKIPVKENKQKVYIYQQT
jgi:hypothetical protein